MYTNYENVIMLGIEKIILITIALNEMVSRIQLLDDIYSGLNELRIKTVIGLIKNNGLVVNTAGSIWNHLQSHV